MNVLQANVKITLLIFIMFLFPAVIVSQENASTDDIDARVSSFLEKNNDEWHDLNIPYSDGRTLYDIIVKNGYTRALEIGTSTGHSGIWIAWALSKTGGKLITIEIDRERHNQAIEYFREAGVSEYIDARLADAHELVKKLEGPFDFVFSDTDKEWYLKYFDAVHPKLEHGGCFTAHNVSNIYNPAIREFLEYIKKNSEYETSIDTSSRAGISISMKK